MAKINKIAVVGSGYFSQFHYAAWQRLEGVTVNGLYTLDADSGDEMCKRFGIPVRYQTLEELIASAPDLVDVIVPPEAQLELLKTLADHHIPCICQKPFCADLPQARAAVDYFAERKTRLVIHENFRHQPWYRAIKQCLDEQRLGEIYQVTYRLRPGDGQGPDAYLARQPYFRDQPQFLVRETAVHFIDVLRFLCGEISGVFADLVRLNPVIKGEDAGLILLRFENGVRGLIDGNRLSDHASSNTRLTMGEMSIEGAKGEITLDGSGCVRWRAQGDVVSQEISFEWSDTDFGGDCVYLTQKHIIESINAGVEPENKARDYLINRFWEQQAYASSDSGVWCNATGANRSVD